MPIDTWGDRPRIFSNYQTFMDNQRRIEAMHVYLAKPGRRLLGVLNGIREETCVAQVNLNNTCTLEFDLDRMLDDEMSAWYDRVERHMELLVPGLGWFKINEEPTVHNDGTNEYMSVRAESREITLQQYMLKGFEVNTGTVQSLEYLATDNTYCVDSVGNVLTAKQIKASEADGSNLVAYTFARENVRFYWDTDEFEEFVRDHSDATVSELIGYVDQYPTILASWRVVYDLKSVDDAIQRLVDQGEMSGCNMDGLRGQKGKIKTHEALFALMKLYPALRTVTSAGGTRLLKVVDIDLKSYNKDHEEDYTVSEVLQMEVKRRKNLSLLTTLLSEHNWKVGHVDNKIVSEEGIEVGLQVVDFDLTKNGQVIYPTYSSTDSLSMINFIAAGSSDDLTPLCDKVGVFEVDSDSIYGFMTQQLATYFRCMFVFDTLNNEVNCYTIDNVGNDTNIILSFRNIQNSVERSGDENLVTAIYVQGGDQLDITEANFGSFYLYDISYFLNTDHFSQSFIDKYRAWQTFRDDKRNEYIYQSVRYRDQLDTASELYDRVPADGVNTHQYSTFSDQELVAERAKYEAMKAGYEQYYVDDQGEFDIDALRRSEDWPDYFVIVNQILSSPLDAYGAFVFQPNRTVQGESVPYNDYVLGVRQTDASGEYIIDDDGHYVFETDEFGNIVEMPNARLGNIDIYLVNRNIANGTYCTDDDTADTRKKKTNYKIQRDYLENYLYDFEHYGFTYGLGELKVKAEELKNQYQSLWAQGYGDDGDTADPYYESQHALCMKYKRAYDQCVVVRDQRQREYDDAVAAYKQTAETLKDLRELVDITNSRFGFTPEELALLDEYYIYSDYVNENIITTEIYKNNEILLAESQLVSDAQDELYSISHPQYRWQTTQDNLLLMPELENWHGQLDVGNFIRLKFRDDDVRETGKLFVDEDGKYLIDEQGCVLHDYPPKIEDFDANQVKMRIIAISFNPFMTESTIDLTFSNMIQYKSKRNDFVQLLNMTSNAQANKITATVISKLSSNTSKIIGGRFTQL